MRAGLGMEIRRGAETEALVVRIQQSWGGTWRPAQMVPPLPFSIIGPLLFSSPLSSQLGSHMCWGQGRREQAPGLGLA